MNQNEGRIKELQKVIANQRINKENIELAIHDCKVTLKQIDNAIADLEEELEILLKKQGVDK